jgi:hypothetical protein
VPLFILYVSGGQNREGTQCLADQGSDCMRLQVVGLYQGVLQMLLQSLMLAENALRHASRRTRPECDCNRMGLTVAEGGLIYKALASAG